MIPSSYRILHACANCAHAFHWQAYDHGDEFFCTLEAPARPPCGSLFMEVALSMPAESFGVDVLDEGWNEASDAWEAWAEAQKVENHGACDHWRAQA